MTIAHLDLSGFPPFAAPSTLTTPSPPSPSFCRGRIDRPEKLTRLDCQRFSRFSVVGDLRRPQTPAPGLTPAQTRARDFASGLRCPLALAFSLRAAFPIGGKEKWPRRQYSGWRWSYFCRTAD